MFCWFLLYNKVNQLLIYVCIYPLSLEPPSHPATTSFHCGTCPFRLEIIFQKVLERTFFFFGKNFWDLFVNWKLRPREVKMTNPLKWQNQEPRSPVLLLVQASSVHSVANHPVCPSTLLRTHPTLRMSRVSFSEWGESARRELLIARQFGNVKTASYFHWKGIPSAFITYLFTDLSTREAMKLVTPSFQAFYCFKECSYLSPCFSPFPILRRNLFLIFKNLFICLCWVLAAVCGK